MLRKICLIVYLFVFLTSGCISDQLSVNDSNSIPKVDSLPNVNNGEQNDTGSSDEYNEQNNSQGNDEDRNDNKDDNDDEEISDINGEDNEQIIDYSDIKPNEAGKIMIIMFHKFIKEYVSGDKEYTMTLLQFENLLQDLYDKDYRLISLTDYINGDINLEAGYIPLVFTFDDATSGQFNLLTVDNELVINPDTAVGIMKKFNEEHPDFGMEGTFFVNMDQSVFQGEATIEQRLNYLVSEGFEIGNHTFNHANLSELNSEQEIQKQIGLNAKKVMEIIPGYEIKHFSLPYGALPNDNISEYLINGVYDGIEYKNKSVLLVGWDPAPSPYVAKFDPHSLPRVRAPGIESVYGDLNWWLDNLSRQEQFVSDGSVMNVVVHADSLSNIDKNKTINKNIVSYP